MSRIELYTTGQCPYCVRAKMLLQNKGVVWEEIRVDQDPAQLQIMLQRSQRRTVPQIFINDQAIGGYDELAALNRSGELDSLLDLS
ncbi:MAG: glutaredoxin 3 [Pseudomonadota bacterium]